MKTAASKLSLLLAVVAAAVLPAAAQYTSPIARGARSGAMGGSFFYEAGKSGLAADYRSGYLLAALGERGVRVQVATGRRGTALAAYSHHGNAEWHEQQVLLLYGLQASPRLHAAVAARWLHRGVDDAHYESRQWLAPSLLLQAALPGVTLTLVGGTRPWDAARPWRWHVQAAYRPSGQWTAVAEWEGEERSRLRAGVEYVYADSWMLRAGMATRPAVMSFGLGFCRGALRVDLAAEVHSLLGITPQTSLALWF
ncbi:MAG: hypothetical protein IJ524_09560 [Bacteroidales bacterium]|nr:hypothetical protein [Bacteroidales bacterium]